jgi:hypothetical protein
MLNGVVKEDLGVARLRSSQGRRDGPHFDAVRIAEPGRRDVWALGGIHSERASDADRFVRTCWFKCRRPNRPLNRRQNRRDSLIWDQ